MREALLIDPVLSQKSMGFVTSFLSFSFLVIPVISSPFGPHNFFVLF